MRGRARASIRGLAVAAVASAASWGLAPTAARAQDASTGGEASGAQQAAGGLRVEFLGGMTIGSHTASAAALDMAPSVSLGVGASMSVWRPDFAVFAAYQRAAFGCEEGYCLNRGYTVTGNHGAVGLEWAPRRAWMRAGLLFGVVTAGDAGSNFGIGVLGAGGFTLDAGKLRLKPGVSYRWMQAATETEPNAKAIALGLEFGLDYLLGGA